ncbi:MAG: ATP synthase F1 subunit gamma [Candidatus Paceibacterota bacterium]
MPNSKEIKNRIKSVKNTKKITKAMELVAASKMKRAVNSTFASRAYAGYSWEILTSIARNVEDITHPLFVEKKDQSGKILLILITSNRGLCGAYNAQVIKKALSMFKGNEKVVDVITIGKKGDMAMRRIGKNVLASFSDLPDDIALSSVTPISRLAVEEFNKGNYDKVLVDYTDYVSALTQTPNIKQIIPISQTDLKELIDSIENIKPKSVETRSEKKIDYLFEGDQNALIGSLAKKITQMQLYQMLLESNASEQSSRMLAMKNASDASGEMIDDLTLVFNKARQSNITREISEISAGMASVS